MIIKGKKTRVLRKLLERKKILVVPAAYDCISAKIVEHVGFEAVYMSGAGVSASRIGKPDIGLMTMTEQVDQARNIANSVDIPVIADADTGYGNPINVMRTVNMFEQAGVAAIHLEDQEMPKRCGHMEGKTVISRESMVQKIKAAAEARMDKDFFIIARTDAKAIYGLDDAIERGRAYVAAGADGIFVEAPESIDELRKIAQSFSVPLLVNRPPSKKTPWLSSQELEDLGFKIVIFPGYTNTVVEKALIDLFTVLKTTGNITSSYGRMLTGEDSWKLMGLEKYRALEKKYGGT